MTESDLLFEVDAERVLALALARGGELADIFAESKSTTVIEIEAGRVERMVQGSRSGAGVRVLHDHRSAYSYCDEIASGPLSECARIAALAVKDGGTRAAIHAGRPWDRRRVTIADPASAVSVEAKLELMWRAEREARRIDKRIKQVRVIFADQGRRIAVADSSGLRAADESEQLMFYVVVVAASGDGLQVAHESAGGTAGMGLFADNDPEDLARLAALRALRNLDARPAPAGTMPVVLAAEAGGTMIHEAVGHGLEADLAHEGLSVYKDRIGETIASPLITVLDDSTLPGKRGSFSFDDEGSPAQRTVLVDQGVLKTYMYDRRLALKNNAASTGNGRRESYSSPPIVRMTNTMIAPGKSRAEDVVRSVERGLLVKRMGGGEVNTVTGDFVFDVEEGWLIEKGAPVEAVRGATLTGNGPRVLSEIDMVADDLGFGLGTCGKDGQGAPVSDAQPTLRIPAIVVGGRME